MKKFTLLAASILILISLTGCRRDNTRPMPQSQPAQPKVHKEMVTYADAQKERESGVLTDKSVGWTEEDFE